ncbi:Isoquinoline 1-oxidoreductase subunit [Melittangium boletus]|uniref:Ioquinoline 1-oxidoreductase subunit n=1 Tax=Melittangium boletus DSM 14713 TaxID=1294270 RepID=A0A250IIJ7_9BACT|nr:Isoquinoline 1-oxidoreductase subunit [Melittangium boletus]ATB31644.1 ioquinoline 1-oxidoreductase subunit [Melittangium boletus DSM 14713]
MSRRPEIIAATLAGAGALCTVLALACAGRGNVTPASTELLPPVPAQQLRTPDMFTRITSRPERSRALFLEASRVMLHPRCTNCHPAGDSPAQGELGQPHDPPVFRGAADQGVPGLECTSCHQDKNLAHARVPGAPKWHLAPRSMAWVGLTPHALCEQLKDRKRNGDKSLEQIIEHSAHDELVAWGWAPGWDRVPAPGTQEQFGALIAAWVQDGAECPTEEARP